jgi:hypothetical protein
LEYVLPATLNGWLTEAVFSWGAFPCNGESPVCSVSWRITEPPVTYNGWRSSPVCVYDPTPICWDGILEPNTGEQCERVINSDWTLW